MTKKNRSKYLVFDSQVKQGIIKKYTELWDGIKNEIETMSGGKQGEYGNKFYSDDHLPLKKLLKRHMLTIVARSVFEEDGKFHSQIYLDECLYEL